MTDLDPQTWLKAAAFLGGGLCMGLGAIGAAIGEGHTAACANEAISRNPKMAGDIFKNMLVGQAVAESAAIFALVVAMVLLFSSVGGDSILSAAALMGAALCMGFGAIGSGVGSGFPAGAACQGIERQPEMAKKLTTNMLIGAAVCQTPSIFALVVAFILLYTDVSGMAVWPTWAAYLGAGLAMGLAAIGSGLGGGRTAKGSVEGISRHPETARPVTMIMLLGQAVTQTPAIFALVIAFILIYTDFSGLPVSPTWAALLGAGLATGLAAIGSGIGGGRAGEACCEGISRRPQAASALTVVMLLGQAVVQSPAIFGLLISFILLFGNFPETAALAPAMALLSAGLCVGFGAIGPALGGGEAAYAGVRGVAYAPEANQVITRIMLVGMAVGQSTVIYAMVISLVLIYVV